MADQARDTEARDCANCGASLHSCNQIIKQHGSGCCPACFMRDTHGLAAKQSKEPGLIERIEALEKACADSTAELLHYVADQTVFRSSLFKEMSKFNQRINRLEERDLHEAGLQRAIEDRDELIRDMDAAVQGLPVRVDFLEECVEGLEKFFKLRRQKARPTVVGAELRSDLTG